VCLYLHLYLYLSCTLYLCTAPVRGTMCVPVATIRFDGCRWFLLCAVRVCSDFCVEHILYARSLIGSPYDSRAVPTSNIGGSVELQLGSPRRSAPHTRRRIQTRGGTRPAVTHVHCARDDRLPLALRSTIYEDRRAARPLHHAIHTLRYSVLLLNSAYPSCIATKLKRIANAQASER
jgi:hypothetical protein